MSHRSIIENHAWRNSRNVDPLSALRNEEDSDFPMLQTRPGRASRRAGRDKRLPLPGNGLLNSQDLLSRVPPADCLTITTKSVNGQIHLEKSAPLNQPVAFASLPPVLLGL